MTAQNGAPSTIGGLPLNPDGPVLSGDEWFPYDLTPSGPTYRGQISDIVTLAAGGSFVPLTREINTIDSLQGGGPLSADLTLSLQGDAASPGASKYYGTDSGSNKGYHDLTGLTFAASQITGLVQVNQGGTGTATPSLVPGLNVSITGAWPNQTVSIVGPGTGTVQQVNTGTGLSGGPITVSGTVSLANTAVVPGSYTLASITVDQQGRITAAANGSAGTVTSITAGTGLSGGTITGAGTIAITAPTARTDQATQWTASVDGAAPVALTDAAPTTWTMGTTNTFVWVLGGDHVLSNPTSSVSGGSGVIYIDQAGHAASFGSNIKVVGLLPATGETICGWFVKGSNVTVVVGGLTGF